MNQVLAFILIATGTLVAGEDGVNVFIFTLESLNYNYYSAEAKEVAENVGEFMANLLEGLEDILEKVKTQNCVSDSLKNFQDTVNAAKATKCTIVTPKGYEDAEDTISAAADACAFSVSVDDLLSVLQEIRNIETQIKDLDAKLKTNPSNEVKIKVVAELKSVFSVEVIKKLNQLVLSDIKIALDKCMKDATKELWTDLESCTKKIKDCLATSAKA